MGAGVVVGGRMEGDAGSVGMRTHPESRQKKRTMKPIVPRAAMAFMRKLWRRPGVKTTAKGDEATECNQIKERPESQIVIKS